MKRVIIGICVLALAVGLGYVSILTQLVGFLIGVAALAGLAGWFIVYGISCMIFGEP